MILIPCLYPLDLTDASAQNGVIPWSSYTLPWQLDEEDCDRCGHDAVKLLDLEVTAPYSYDLED